MKKHKLSKLVLKIGILVLLSLGIWLSKGGIIQVHAEIKHTDGQRIYRVYNPNTGEHFYPTSPYEREEVLKKGWRDEGILATAPTSGTAIYRLYNPKVEGGDHYYTSSFYEATALVKAGWQWDHNAKAVFYSGGSQKVYIAYNPNAKSGAHNYTVSSYEQSSLLSRGWKFGTTAWYALAPGEMNLESDKATITSDPNNPLGQIDFANEKWDVIKGPDQMGSGNYLIAMQESVGRSFFNDLHNGEYYFQENENSLDGYQSDDNFAKEIVDDWYEDYIAGTACEQYVQPVVLNNPTLGNMKAPVFGGWDSNAIGNSKSGFLAINQPDAFPTIVGGSEKQAFLMSGSDISDGKGEFGNLIPGALAHSNNLWEVGVTRSWLRSPGGHSRFAAYLSGTFPYVCCAPVNEECYVVPSLVVHVP